MSKITITATVRVEVDTEKWAAEYSCTELDAEADALKYVPELLGSALARQQDWGVVTSVEVKDTQLAVRITRVGREEVGEAGEDSAAPAPGQLIITPQGQAKIDEHLARRSRS